MVRPRKPNGPQPTAPEGCPEKPTDLSPEASAEWDLLVGELTELGTISEVDRLCVTMAARYAGHYAQAAAEVQRGGLTIATKQGIKAHPSLRARDDSARILKSYLDALGLTPSSRSRVATTRTEGEQTLEDILSGDTPKKTREEIAADNAASVARFEAARKRGEESRKANGEAS